MSIKKTEYTTEIKLLGKPHFYKWDNKKIFLLQRYLPRDPQKIICYFYKVKSLMCWGIFSKKSYFFPSTFCFSFLTFLIFCVCRLWRFWRFWRFKGRWRRRHRRCPRCIVYHESAVEKEVTMEIKSFPDFQELLCLSITQVIKS